jgi:hypothetical protein
VFVSGLVCLWVGWFDFRWTGVFVGGLVCL